MISDIKGLKRLSLRTHTPRLSLLKSCSSSSTMATRRRNIQLRSVSVDLNVCRPKLSHLFHPKQKASAKSRPETVSEWDSEWERRSWMRLQGVGRSGGESVAVEKDSDDPYLDFRHSMVQMIVENEIYGKEDLRGLLRCFLHLNSRSHHRIIITAFSDIWDSVFPSSAFHYSPSI